MEPGTNYLQASTSERIAAAIATNSSHANPAVEKLGQHHGSPSVTSSEQDELDLQKLGYKPVLARGWGGFDNFACSFSALYCIGGIRVLFYIALSAGGPAAMYVPLRNPTILIQALTNITKDGVPGSQEVFCQ